MSYSMGQYLYNSTDFSNGTYTTEINKEVSGVKLNGSNFRDLKITPSDNFSFNYGTSYLLDLKIPRNSTYNLQIDLKLMNENNDELNTNQYQEIKRIYVPKAENAQDVSTVVLYEDPTNPEQVYSGVLRDIAEDCKFYDVYTDNLSAKNPVYYYKSESELEPIKIENKRIIELAHTWDQKEENTFQQFYIIFSPKTDAINFNRIILELVRNTYDNDITFTIDNTSYNGVHIDEENEVFSATLYIVNNLLNTSDGKIKHNEITHLSVWSHSDLIMAINGEEIKVGPSGYYELNDFNITSLGIACMTSDDKFTIDYQYEI